MPPIDSHHDTKALDLQEFLAEPERFLDEVRRGRHLSIHREHEPMVEIRPSRPLLDRPRRPGLLKGKIFMADDFDETPAEILESIERPLD